MLTAAIASARGAPTLAVGNVIGTNVTIVTAALGLSAFIFPMVIDRSVRRQALNTQGPIKLSGCQNGGLTLLRSCLAR